MKTFHVVTMIFGLRVLLMLGSARATTTFNFDVGSATTSNYATFIDSLRNAVKYASLRCYGIPMLPPTDRQPKYVLVELKADTKTITLMYNRNNLYIMGYSDPLNGKCRYHIFKDVTDRTDARDTMCPDKKNRLEKNISYDSSYSAIERKAGKERSKMDIGIAMLKRLIRQILGEATFAEKDEAQFLLAAIQMTSEAARFKYIENLIMTDLNIVRPDHKMMRLEETWGKISKGIHDAQNGIIDPPLSLNATREVSWKVGRVDEIKPDISLLNYNNGSCKLDAILIAALNYMA